MAAEAPAEPVPEGEATEVGQAKKLFVVAVFKKKRLMYLCIDQVVEEEVLPPACMDLTGFPLKTDIFEGS